jgi:DNA ligase-1
LIDEKRNLRIGGLALSLDGDQLKDCYISHAHSDHTSAARKKGKNILASEATMALIGKDGKFGAVKAPDGVKLRMIRAGHMLGATQLVAEWDGSPSVGQNGKFVYTGDFKVEDSFTTKGAEVEECDYLLMESTYSSPTTKFPPREEVGAQIAKWVHKESKLNTVLLGGYSTGKSQELVSLLNAHGIVPLVHPRIEKVCAVYERFGVKLQRVAMDSEEGEEMKRRDFVGVMPFHLVNRELAYEFSRVCNRGVTTALATGWANTFYYPVDHVFPLSDHADFGEMLDYMEIARPKQIWCCYGDGEYLARALCAKGWNAAPLETNGAENRRSRHQGFEKGGAGTVGSAQQKLTLEAEIKGVV